MRNGPPTWNEMHEAMMSCLEIAADRAALSTIEALAKALGITRLEGLPIRDYYYVEATYEAEKGFSDCADYDPALATALKTRWDEMLAASPMKHSKQVMQRIAENRQKAGAQLSEQSNAGVREAKSAKPAGRRQGVIPTRASLS